MIVSDRFMFVHVPKTGGTSIWDALLSLPETKVGFTDEHGIPSWVPKEFLPDGLPTLAFVRNPFDWYWSVWNYSASSKSPEIVKMLVSIFSENGRRDFRKTVEAMMKPSGRIVMNVMSLMSSDPAVRDPAKRFAPAMAERLRTSMSGEAEGLYSWIHSAMLEDRDVFIGKTETLQQSLSDFLVGKCGYAPEQIPVAKRLNVSTSGIPKDAFPSALVDLIREKDDRIFSLGGYADSPYPPFDS